MYGAIIGDIVGSRFEFDRGNKSRDFKLFTSESDFTDDSVMTVAVAEALMDAGRDADEKTVKAWATEQATRHFSEAEQQYYTLIGEACEVLNRVAEFERDNGMRPFAIHGKTYWLQGDKGGTIRRWLRDYLCPRNEQGQPADYLELTPASFINMIDGETLFPAK